MLKEILSMPTEKLGTASRFAVLQVKLWSHCARLLKKNRAGQQAAALAYHTIFGIIPLAIVTLLIFQSFPASSGVGENLKSLVYDQLHLSTIEYPSPTNPDKNIVLTEYLDSIVAGFFKGLNEGSIALFSVIIVIWAALSLLMTIERAFNNIWHISRPRGFLDRIKNYWWFLTFGPLLIGVGIYAGTRYALLGQMHKTLFTHIAPSVISYLIATLAFFLLYFFLPNTRVKAKAAIWSSAFAALIWTAAKWGFGVYVTKFIPYAKVYGVLGLIPLSVFWIYITWLIVLFGLELTFTTQYLKKLDAAEIDRAGTSEKCFIANDLTFINVAREIAAAFARNKAPIASEVICSKLALPPEFGEKILDHLVAAGLIAKASEPSVGFVPVRDPENITLSEIAQAAGSAGFGQSVKEPTPVLDQITNDRVDNLARFNLKQALETENPSNPEQV